MSRVRIPFLIIALVLSSGCYVYSGTERVIDLRARTATLALTDLRSDEADITGELNNAVAGLLLDPGVEDRYPSARATQKDFRVSGEALDFVVQLAFEAPSAMGVQSWDRGGWRVCPSEPDMVISASNAAYRDGDGCVIWKKRATVLRVTETRTGVKPQTSLLGAYKVWDAAGRPAPGADAKAGESTTPPP